MRSAPQDFRTGLEDPAPFPFEADRVLHRARHQFLILDGVLYGVGENDNGQLGDGTTSFRPEPVALDVPEGVIDVDCSSNTCCALTSLGELWCWASGFYGPPSVAIEPTGPTPALFEGVPSFCSFENDGNLSCGWTCSGEVTCWGSNVGGASWRRKAIRLHPSCCRRAECTISSLLPRS